MGLRTLTPPSRRDPRWSQPMVWFFLAWLAQLSHARLLFLKLLVCRLLLIHLGLLRKHLRLPTRLLLQTRRPVAQW